MGRSLPAVEMRHTILITGAPIPEWRIEHIDPGRTGHQLEIVPGRETRPDDADLVLLVEPRQAPLPDDQPWPGADQPQLGEFCRDVGDVLDAVQSISP